MIAVEPLALRYRRTKFGETVPGAILNTAVPPTALICSTFCPPGSVTGVVVAVETVLPPSPLLGVPKVIGMTAWPEPFVVGVPAMSVCPAVGGVLGRGIK
jgi:hypothetical protein